MLNVTYPLVPEEWVQLLQRQARRAGVEEGQPEFIEQAANADSAPARRAARALLGKEVLPMQGEYTVDVLRKGLGEFLEEVGAAVAARPPRDCRAR